MYRKRRNRSLGSAWSSGSSWSLGRVSRIAVLGAASLGCMQSAIAHEPDRRCDPVTPRVDLIGPIGNNLPIGHRRRYNRPSYLEGKIAYKIAPSSQEAMAWHRAEHNGAYSDEKKCQRYETHYWYPKPWQVLRVGQRPSALATPQTFDPISNGIGNDLDNNDLDDSEQSDAVNLTDPMDLPDSNAPELQEPELNGGGPDLNDAAESFEPVSIATPPVFPPALDVPLFQTSLTAATELASAQEESSVGDSTEVSHTRVSQTKSTLEKLSKPVWFRKLLSRGPN